VFYDPVLEEIYP